MYPWGNFTKLFNRYHEMFRKYFVALLRGMAKQTPSKTEIQAAYTEFKAGLKEIQKELRELVVRTIQTIDQKQATKILNRIKNL